MMESRNEVIESIEIDIRFKRESLANRCRQLSDILLRLANKLHGDSPNDMLHINSLGEIQSSGTTIDAQCGELYGMISVLEEIKKCK